MGASGKALASQLRVLRGREETVAATSAAGGEPATGRWRGQGVVLSTLTEKVIVAVPPGDTVFDKVPQLAVVDEAE